MEKEEKVRLIKDEKERLKTKCSRLDCKRKQIAHRLCAKAAYLKVSLEEMQEDIDENGYYEKFSQGKDQEPYDRIRPVVNTFNSFTSGYQKYLKQITDMMPKQVAKTKEKDGFEDFVYGRED